MENVKLWYISDKEHDKKLVEAIRGIGLSLALVSCCDDMINEEIESNIINMFITDITRESSETLLEQLNKDSRMNGCVKFVLLPKKEIKDALKLSYNYMHIEFISKPINLREFLLLLEKTIIVERYRELMKFVSKEAEYRIETYEGLMDINRKNIFESEKEKTAFEKIITYEKNLLKEQSKLNSAIRDFTILRQKEFFDLQKRIKAEEMLAELRRKELLDAQTTIQAQQSVIHYSAQELDQAKKIISASENVAELGRNEALELHEELTRHKEMSKSLSEEVERLLKENESLKKQLG